MACARTDHGTRKKGRPWADVHHHDQLLEFMRMVVTAGVGVELVGDWPDATGDPILMGGLTWTRCRGSPDCGGATDERACLYTRMLRRLELIGGGTPRQNVLHGCKTP